MARLDINNSLTHSLITATGSEAFTWQDGLAWAVLEDSIDGEFFPALLPHATLIVMFSPREDSAGKWNAKFRLGLAAPVDFSVAETQKAILASAPAMSGI